MLSLTQLVRTPRDTGPRQRRKGGHYRTPFGRHLRTLNPYLLLLVLKTTGLNDSDERKSFIVPKTVNLHKLKKQKITTNFLWGEDRTNRRRRRRKRREEGGRKEEEWGHWIWIVLCRVCLKIRQLCWIAERSQGAKAISIVGNCLHWQEGNLKDKYQDICVSNILVLIFFWNWT